MLFLFNIQTSFATPLNAFLYWFSNCLGLVFFVLYAHQFFYLFVGLKVARVKKTEFNNHRYGIIVSARNEELVIGYLIESIRKNDYPQDLVDILVVADNCTDKTAQICRDLGCRVYERNDLQKVGKGYAMHFIFDKIHNDPELKDKYEAYIVLDADNILSKNYITELNKVYDSGYKAITSYRNTKNFGKNWIGDGYGYWFLHEARSLNNPRMLLKTSCAISGTGFLIDAQVIKEYDNWCFFTLTEDIEFSAQYALSRRKIGYAHDAVLYDEQPTTFKQAWRQRERWSKGFYQVFGSKAGKLFKNMWSNFSCWDILTGIFPALMISTLMFIVYPICMIIGATTGNVSAVQMAGQGLGFMVLMLYASIFLYGLFVLMTEWKRIKMPWWKKIWRNFTFPLFMFTYLPIALSAAFRKVEWKPIYHNHPVSMSDLGLDGEEHDAASATPKEQKTVASSNRTADKDSADDSPAPARQKTVPQNSAPLTEKIPIAAAKQSAPISAESNRRTAIR
jgi:cellulose synthase/poly-beta-1,6-N-acetylglucosamine synthase-like glycosyltransferase